MSAAATSPVVTVHPDWESWLAARRQKLTSSDIPPLLGCYPSAASKERKNPYALWLQKTGQATDDDPAMQLRFDLGRIVEPRIAEEVEKRTGVALEDLGDFTTVEERGGILMATPDRLIGPPASPELPWWSPDAELPSVFAKVVAGARGTAEFKTDAVQQAKGWEESAKFDYALVQWHVSAMCCQKDEGLIATCFGMGLEFDVFPVVRSDDLCALIRERAEEFWDFVQRGEPPSSAYLDSSEAVGRALGEIYRQESGEEVELDPDEWLPLVEERFALKEAIKGHEERIREIDNLARATLGPATYGRIPGYGKRWQWAKEERKGYTVEASSRRALRLVKA